MNDPESSSTITRNLVKSVVLLRCACGPPWIEVGVDTLVIRHKDHGEITITASGPMQAKAYCGRCHGKLMTSSLTGDARVKM